MGKNTQFVNNEMRYEFSEDDIDFLEFQEARKSEKAGKGFLFVGSKKVKMQVELTEVEKKLWFDKEYDLLSKV